MRACMCILAGTKACENCSNASSEIPMRMPVFPGEMKPKTITKTWTVTTLSEIPNEKNKNRKS